MKIKDRSSLILLNKARRKLIKELNKSKIGQSTMIGSTQMQTFDQKSNLDGRSTHSMRSNRSRFHASSHSLLGDALNKDKETTMRQMEVIQRIREKEALRFQKYIMNEERK
jgi:hypothetical protein